MRTNTAGKRRRRRRRVRDPELTADDAERAETDDAASAGKESGRQRGTALGGARGGRGGQRRRRHGAGGVGGAVGRKGGVLEGGGGGDETASGGRERDASAVGEGGVLRSRREQAGAAGSASRAEKLAVAKGERPDSVIHPVLAVEAQFHQRRSGAGRPTHVRVLTTRWTHAGGCFGCCGCW